MPARVAERDDQLETLPPHGGETLHVGVVDQPHGLAPASGQRSRERKAGRPRGLT
jgi:hypothetical protein